MELSFSGKSLICAGKVQGAVSGFLEGSGAGNCARERFVCREVVFKGAVFVDCCISGEINAVINVFFLVFDFSGVNYCFAGESRVITVQNEGSGACFIYGAKTVLRADDISADCFVFGEIKGNSVFSARLTAPFTKLCAESVFT